MLQLRVIAPTDLRKPVIDLLTGNTGVTHLVVHADAALDPGGDEITAVLAGSPPTRWSTGSSHWA